MHLHTHFTKEHLQDRQHTHTFKAYKVNNTGSVYCLDIPQTPTRGNKRTHGLAACTGTQEHTGDTVGRKGRSRTLAAKHLTHVVVRGAEWFASQMKCGWDRER